MTRVLSDTDCAIKNRAWRAIRKARGNPVKRATTQAHDEPGTVSFLEYGTSTGLVRYQGVWRQAGSYVG